MGLLLSCDKCTPSGTESVITFSDKLIERITLGAAIDDEESQSLTMVEADWIDRIKCIDDTHTSAYGLTTDAFNAMIRNLEIRFKRETDKASACAQDEMFRCFERNPACPLKCNEQTQLFQECTDAARLRRLKVKIDELNAKQSKVNKKSKK